MDNKDQNETPQKILSPEPLKAAQEMTQVIERLCDLLEQETRALMQNNSVAFLSNEADKMGAIALYEAASEEFKERLYEFRRIDQSIFDNLNTAQERLSEISRDNIKVLEEYKSKNGKIENDKNQ